MSPATLTHYFAPRGAAQRLFHSKAREVLLDGPAGTGKSRACLEKLHMTALLNPEMRGLMVRKTMVSLTTSALVTWQKFVAKEAIENGTVMFYGGGPEKPPGYRYSNGSFIAIGGMDKPSKIMSTEYDMVYVQEATELTVDDWEAITTRMRNWVVPFQQVIADCNPNVPSHWLNVRANNGTVRRFLSKHTDNPMLYDDAGNVTVRGAAYMANLHALTGVRKDRLLHGLWTAAEGLVWEEFSSDHNVIDQFPIPLDWPRYWVIDFGYTNPFVCQWWAEDPDGRLYLYREIYRTKRLVEDHARDILSVVQNERGQWKEPHPIAIICDHDAEDRATLERHLGLGTQPAWKTVKDGIQAVESRWKVQDDGKPRMYLLRDAVVEPDQDLIDRKLPWCTIEEIPAYVWEPPILGRPPKEVPKKENDHGADGVRYVTAYRDLQGIPRVRFMGGAQRF